MTYTIEELEAAITNEDTSWEGSWGSLEYSADHTWEFVRDEAGQIVRDGNNQAVKRELPPAEQGKELPGIGRVLVIDSYGGEGQGEERWFVFKVTDTEGNERIFRKDGYYASHYGTDWDGDVTEVEQVKKMIDVWEAVK